VKVNSISDPAHESTYILLGGTGWFPKSPGGMERYVYELAHHLAACNDQVELCGIGLPETPKYLPIRLTNLAEPATPLWKRFWSSRSNFLNRPSTPLDAINLHFALYSLPLMGILPERVPVTFTFHGPWAIESRQEGASQLSSFFKQWFVEYQVYRRCDRFIVLSKAFGNILHQHYQVPWEKIHIIPGGVDLNRFQYNLSRQEARTQLEWPQDRPILFTPRRLVHRMGLGQLLKALVQVKQQVPDIWLAVAGKGPLRESLEQQTIELGLSNNVKLLGYLPDEQLPIAYQAADLTIMPSQSLEGFGLVLLESLACGTPALCTPVGGMPEILEPFSPELITDSIEASAIADRLSQLLTGEVLLPTREACRDYAATHFDWYQIAQRVRQVLLA
jgi:glycosyltransferase involved in cell wall biosynthesis